MEPSPSGAVRRAGGLLLALGLGACLASCGKDELARHMDKGRDLYDGAKYEEAQLEGLYVLLREPENEEALHLVALSLLAQDRDGEAEGYFRSLGQIKGQYAQEAAALYAAKAVGDYQQNERMRAARRWNTALGFNPGLELGPYAFFMARQAYEARDWERAAYLYARARAAYPDSSAISDALYPHAVTLSHLDRHREALAILEPFVKNYPRHRQRHEAIWLYQELLIREAQSAQSSLDYEGAVTLLRKALEYEDNPPKTAEALLELGHCFEQLQDYRAAASCYQKIINANVGGVGRIYDSALARLEKLEKARLR
jgi:tetratricopeptide (TPR) repeat protein